MMDQSIETFDLTRRYRGVCALDRVNLRVPRGSIFALVGPNGAGKTTALTLLMNLIRPTSGRATVLGTDTRRLGVREFQRIGYVSENQQLPDWLTPRELVDYLRPFYASWDDWLCRTLRDVLVLDEDRPLRKLSRGTRMKAALLAALAFRPELVVLDEPFTGLDPLVRDELARALLEMPGDRPWTVMLSSHDIEEVERLADWIGFLDRGRLAFAEPVASLVERCRMIEVIGPTDVPPTARAPLHAGWLMQGGAGRTLRFVDTRHDAPGAGAAIAAAFPGCEVRTSALSVREIFVALARQSALRARAEVRS